MKISLLLVMMAFICSCAMPATTVRTIDDRPSISINGAPEEAMLFLDGIAMGKASRYDGQPNVLKVEPGTHRIKVTDESGILYDKDVFVESELKTITVK